MPQIVSFFTGVILAVVWTVYCIVKFKNWKVVFKLLIGWIVIAVVSLGLMFTIEFFRFFGWWGLLILAIVIGMFTPTVYHVKIHK